MKKNLVDVIRFLEAAVADMHANNRKKIKCPCRNCKDQVWMDPFKGGHLKAHLVMHGFMNGYTRWISEDDFEDAGHGEDVVHEEDAGLHGQDVVHEEDAGHGEDVINEEQDGGHGEDGGTQQYDSFALSSVMQDPHVRELLRKNTTSERTASREEAKLAQLELDSKTPLYEGF